MSHFFCLHSLADGSQFHVKVDEIIQIGEITENGKTGGYIVRSDGAIVSTAESYEELQDLMF